VPCTTCKTRIRCLKWGRCFEGNLDEVQAKPEPREEPVQEFQTRPVETPDVEAHSSPDGDKQEALEGSYERWCHGEPDSGSEEFKAFRAGWNAHAELVTHECALVGPVDGALNSQSGAAEKSGSASTKPNEIGAEGWIPVSAGMPEIDCLLATAYVKWPRPPRFLIIVWDKDARDLLEPGLFTHYVILPELCEPPKESSKELKA
jgi:hypothetical protein